MLTTRPYRTIPLAVFSSVSLVSSPGIEPGPPGWESGMLTTRPYRTAGLSGYSAVRGSMTAAVDWPAAWGARLPGGQLISRVARLFTSGVRPASISCPAFPRQGAYFVRVYLEAREVWDRYCPCFCIHTARDLHPFEKVRAKRLLFVFLFIGCLGMLLYTVGFTRHGSVGFPSVLAEVNDVL